ncbi:hypothetical protein [Siccirubricoccus sp. G192]|uniref:hypothetical protein n=1 Tax=Siccirubricoccus sp. G192 TaxID=2849651 RepID=UPI001C2C0497|nr:hypothetical protein [Siccirubricoccus sp. G192]MBV1796860.1 hypothetical protein [Siccirubricoccus sp. G192]
MGRRGDGGLGPPLTGPDYAYNTSTSDVGMFSIIHGGAYGAMASFARRGLQQDQILKIIAHIRSLSADAGGPGPMTGRPAPLAGPPLRGVPRTIWHDRAMRRAGTAAATGAA